MTVRLTVRLNNQINLFATHFYKQKMHVYIGARNTLYPLDLHLEVIGWLQGGL